MSAKTVKPVKKAEKVGIQSPWQTYQGMLTALFANDPEVTVGQIDEDDGAIKTITVSVKDSIKAYALSKILKTEIPMGNITVHVDIEDATPENGKWTKLAKTAFEGNGFFADVVEATDVTGIVHTFPLAQPELVQFYNDDISDYYCNFNGSPSAVAKDVCVEDPLLQFSVESKKKVDK